MRRLSSETQLTTVSTDSIPSMITTAHPAAANRRDPAPIAEPHCQPPRPSASRRSTWKSAFFQERSTVVLNQIHATRTCHRRLHCLIVTQPRHPLHRASASASHPPSPSYLARPFPRRAGRSPSFRQTWAFAQENVPAATPAPRALRPGEPRPGALRLGEFRLGELRALAQKIFPLLRLLSSCRQP